MVIKVANIQIPQSRFTVSELCIFNPHITEQTLRKFLKEDAEKGEGSRVVQLEVKGEPGSREGKGRKPATYVLRSLAGKLPAVAPVPPSPETSPQTALAKEASHSEAISLVLKNASMRYEKMTLKEKVQLVKILKDDIRAEIEFAEEEICPPVIAPGEEDL